MDRIQLCMSTHLQRTFSLHWSVMAGHSTPIGQMYGVLYLNEFKSDIKQFFENGAASLTENMGAPEMVESLWEEYPKWYILVGENEVWSEILSLYQSSKKANESDGLTKNVFPEPYSSILAMMVEDDENIKPKSAMELLKMEIQRQGSFDSYEQAFLRRRRSWQKWVHWSQQRKRNISKVYSSLVTASLFLHNLLAISIFEYTDCILSCGVTSCCAVTAIAITLLLSYLHL